MREISIKLYTFEELSKESKKKALESLSDINTDHDWWRYTYDDASDVGVMITASNIDRRTIKADFYQDAEATACHILRNHGHDTDTYKHTIDFCETYILCRDDDIGRPCAREAYLSDLCRSYLTILENEYKYLTSEAAIVEAIEAGDWEFTEDGKLY